MLVFRASDQEPADSCENLYWFPQFLNDGSYKSEYNIEWKKYLLNRNSCEIKEYLNSKKRFIFYTPKIVKCIFNLCKMFRQPPEVRYLAVDVFDRFLAEHFLEVCETYERTKRGRNDTWEAIVDRMLSQSPLRILTCVQLAMKYSWSCNIITVTDFKEIIKFLTSDEQYSRRSIIKSEARVYKQLDYNITNRTPFTYLEMFFDDLHTHQIFNLSSPLHNLFTTCIHVLDMATIFHCRIYKTPQETENDSVAGQKANFVLLAASVIFASCRLTDPDPAPSRVRLRILCSAGECNKSDVEELSNRILNVIRDF